MTTFENPNPMPASTPDDGRVPSTSASPNAGTVGIDDKKFQELTDPKLSQNSNIPRTMSPDSTDGARLTSTPTAPLEQLMEHKSKKSSRRVFIVAGAAAGAAALIGGAFALGKNSGDSATRTTNSPVANNPEQPKQSRSNTAPSKPSIEVVPLEKLELPKETPSETMARLKIIEQPTPWGEIPVYQATKTVDQLLKLAPQQLTNEPTPNRALALIALEYQLLKGYQLNEPRKLANDADWYDRKGLRAGANLLYFDKYIGDRLNGVDSEIAEKLAALSYLEPTDENGNYYPHVSETISQYNRLANPNPKTKTVINVLDVADQGRRSWGSYNDKRSSDLKLERRSVAAEDKNGSVDTYVKVRIPVVEPGGKVPLSAYMTARSIPGISIAMADSAPLSA